MKRLFEERYCSSLTSRVDKWISQVRKICQNNILRKGCSFDKVFQLFIDGLSLPLNLENELKPLRTALQAVKDWLESSHEALVESGAFLDPLRAALLDGAVGDGAEGDNVNSTGKSSKVGKRITSLDELKRLHSSAAHISLEFSSLR